MPICKKCDKRFKQYQEIDGKIRNFQRRKYCLECSPFGSNNRNKLEINLEEKICIRCGKHNRTNKRKCSACTFSERKAKISKKVYEIIGYSCWKCDYDKGEQATSILEFHHVDPTKKSFELPMRKLMGKKWKDVWKEMQKCVSLCCLCHREHHAGLISKKEIEKIHKEKWEDILSNSIKVL